MCGNERPSIFNENLGSLDEEIGVIEVERVEPRFSVAKIIQGQGFAPGNLVRPVAVVFE